MDINILPPPQQQQGNDNHQNAAAAAAAGDGDDQEALPNIMSQHDPRRMRLTAEEQQWALEIKDAIELIPEVDDLSDFMYAQWALICKDNVDEVVRRAEILQAFRQEYRILDSCEDGCRCVQELIKLFPGFYLSFSFSSQDGQYVLVHDLSKMNTRNLTTPREIKDHFAGVYYMLYALAPDLDSVRKGSIGIVECEGLDWRHKQDMKVVQTLFRELMAVFPYKETVKPCNTGVFFNLIGSLLKKVLPEEAKDSFEIGMESEVRLDTVFLVPTMEIANQRMLQRVYKALQMRFKNQRSFSLE